MSIQIQPPKQDLVQKYSLLFVIAGMVLGVIPASVFLISSGGDGVKIGILGLIACLGITGGMLSYKYGD